MSGAGELELARKPRQQNQGVHLSPLQTAVVNLLFILHEHSHLLDDYRIHENASMLIKELYYIRGDAHVKANFMHFLEQKYGADPFKAITSKLMEIFDFDDEAYPYHLFKSGMGTDNYKNAMNSIKYLFDHRMSLPVSLPGCSFPKGPNEWVQKERKLMDDMQDAFTAEMEVDDAKSAADLPFPLQHYERVFGEGIVKLRPLFDHAKATPGAIVCYDGIKDSFENALKKVQELLKERSTVKSVIKRERSQSPGLRRSDRLRKKGGLRKIKTVRRHTPNKHKKTKRRN